jgi:EmrB/QacA subfamily drug resistance transporter
VRIERDRGRQDEGHPPGHELPVDDPDGVGTTTAAAGSIAGVPYRWVAMFVVLFGTFMVVLDTTVVNLGLPSLQRDFDTIVGIEWVVTAYLAAVGVAQMVSGWAADRFGRKAMFVFSLGLFTVSSLLCAAAPTLPALVGARVLQGIGGGLMMPVAMAMIYELFAPDERGRALGWFGIAVMAAPAIGPVLGGSLVSSAGWRWLFLINIPIGLAGFPIAIRLLRDTGFRERRSLDRVGLALGGCGIAALMIGLERGGSAGWSDAGVIGLLALGAALLALLVRHSLNTSQPLVDLRIFANPIFTVGMVSVGLLAVAQFTRLVYIPLELGTVRGISEFRIGVTMFPSALGIALTMPIGGRLADRIGSRVPATIGSVVLGTTFVALAGLTPTTPLPVVSAILFAGGLGSGLAMMAPNIVAMNSVEGRKVSQASALSQVSRQMSAAVGTAVVASIFATSRPDVAPGALSPADALGPYRTVFLLATGIMAVAVVVAQFLPGRATALALQADRRREMAHVGDRTATQPAAVTEF